MYQKFTFKMARTPCKMHIYELEIWLRDASVNSAKWSKNLNSKTLVQTLKKKFFS